jgi:site-specific recombinase XerD
VPLLEQAGLRLPRAGLHALRHTYVSLLIAQGEDVRCIADQVGHATTSLTQDVYAHMFTAVRTAAMQKLDRWVPLGSSDAAPSGSHRAEQAETPGTGRRAEEVGS